MPFTYKHIQLSFLNYWKRGIRIEKDFVYIVRFF